MRLLSCCCLLLFFTSHTTACRNAPKDVYMVMDGSNNMGEKGFVKALNFTTSVVQRLKIAKDKTHVSFTQFADNVYTEFKLMRHTSKTELITAIRDIPYREEPVQSGSKRDGQKALMAVRDQVLSKKSSGTRLNVNDVLMYICSGLSTTDPLPVADELRALGVKIIVLGVALGNDGDEHLARKQLKKLAKFDDNYFEVRKTSDLNAQLGKLISKKTCEDAVDCVVDFPDFSACSVSCGDGVQTRRGQIMIQAKFGGKACPSLDEQRPCNLGACRAAAVDCEVQFGPFSACSASCGGGTRRRTVTVVKEAQFGGIPCPAKVEEEPCNKQPCEQLKESEPASLGTEQSTAPIDCKVQFGAFSPCSKICGGGIRTQFGVVIQEAQNGGKPCTELIKQEKCNLQPCPTAKCAYGGWNNWSSCSVICGGGVQSRSRDVVSKELSSSCLDTQESQVCNVQPCGGDRPMCIMLPDGDFKSGECARKYFSCVAGDLIVRHCQEGLIFDPDNQRCDVPELTRTCTGSSPIPSTPALPFVYTTEPLQYPVDCLNLPDGFVSAPQAGCSDVFYVCSNGVTNEQHCPPGLFFDKLNQQCDSRPYACEGKVRSTTVQFEPSTTETPEFLCDQKKDGRYSDLKQSCSTHFYVCNGGISTKQTCPQGLKFDQNSSTCQRDIDIFACVGKTRPTNAPKTSTAPLTWPPVPMDCTQLEDGDYKDPSSPCVPHYFSCFGGQGVKRICPWNTFFDQELQRCETYDAVPGCSGKPRTTTVESLELDIQSKSNATQSLITF